MTILFIFSPPAFYPDFLRPLVQVFPAEVSIVLVLPVAVAVSAAVEPLRIAVATAAAWPPLEILVAIVAAWPPPGIAVLPEVSIAFWVSTPGRPRSVVSPNDCSFASRSSSV
jgi:hypothetical protein